MDLAMILADTNEERRSNFRQMVRKLASMQDFTYRLFAVGKADVWKESPRTDLSMICLCLIHLDYPDGFALGKKIYEENPFCRVIYYGTGIRDVTNFLPSRPVRYLDLEKGTGEIWKCLNEAYQAIQRDSHYFHYEDRYQMIAHPFSGLLYFSSRERMVYYQTPLGERGPLRRTLDQVEQMLEKDYFLRCHKSYLVRKDLCTALDKTTRELVLSDGCRIPVSRAYWKAIADLFCENAEFTGENYQL